MPAKSPEEWTLCSKKYVNAGDLDSLVDLYEPTATLLAAPGQGATGHDAIRAGLKGFLDGKAVVKLNVTQTITAGDTAVTYNDWTGVMTGPDGAKIEMPGKAIEVCRRQADGTWRFAIDDPFARG